MDYFIFPKVWKWGKRGKQACMGQVVWVERWALQLRLLKDNDNCACLSMGTVRPPATTLLCLAQPLFSCPLKLGGLSGEKKNILWGFEQHNALLYFFVFQIKKKEINLGAKLASEVKMRWWNFTFPSLDNLGANSRFLSLLCCLLVNSVLLSHQ